MADNAAPRTPHVRTGEFQVTRPQSQAPLTSLPQALRHYDITPPRGHQHCQLLPLLGCSGGSGRRGPGEGGQPGCLGPQRAGPWGAELSGGAASPSSPRAVVKRLRGLLPSVMRVDCSPRPCSSFTWGWERCWPRLPAGHALPENPTPNCPAPSSHTPPPTEAPPHAHPTP